jgi:hypothetical protein
VLASEAFRSGTYSTGFVEEAEGLLPALAAR